jgi:hypothetical protein
MPTQSNLHPMKNFNAAEPAILHDRVSGRIITWTGEDASDFLRAKIDRSDGTVAWRAFVFDGWGNVLGG